MIVPIVVLEPEIVHDGRSQNAGKSDDALVGPIPVVRPVGGIAELERRLQPKGAYQLLNVARIEVVE